MGVFRGIVRVRNWECRHGEEEDDETDTAAVQDSSRVTMSSAGGLDSRPLPSTEKIVDVSGTFVGHTTELVLCQGLEPVQSLFFGSLFAGETRTIETLLRNNGPQPLTFKTSISFGGGAAGGGAATGVEEDREAYERRKELRITPADGCIDPFMRPSSRLCTTRERRLRRKFSAWSESKAARCSTADRTLNTLAANSSFDSSSSPFVVLPAPLILFASIICEDLLARKLTFDVSAKTFIPRLQLSPTCHRWTLATFTSTIAPICCCL
ncbi:hypothetical protein PR003_g16351 [Phytophthora rubi]|uniref:Uncharacterized protein n=1 Tax=Phytophthora rubi TaxID=129364 RepID=A0A6A3KUT2_9STRA|nr:hypothetical protein PR002_g16262 [Phytophthora rubi]KAE9325924.1 hypothetical protein PR003_g16351 [Phytophthora rubi]